MKRRTFIGRLGAVLAALVMYPQGSAEGHAVESPGDATPPLPSAGPRVEGDFTWDDEEPSIFAANPTYPSDAYEVWLHHPRTDLRVIQREHNRHLADFLDSFGG